MADKYELANSTLPEAIGKGLYKTVEDGYPDMTLRLTPRVANALADQCIKCGLANGWDRITAQPKDIILYIVQQLESELSTSLPESKGGDGPETVEDALLSTKTLNGIYGFLSTWSTEDVGGGFEWSTKPGEEHVLPDDPVRLLHDAPVHQTLRGTHPGLSEAKFLDHLTNTP